MAGFFKDNPPATQVGSEDATESTIQEDAVTQTDTSGGFFQGSPEQTTTDAYTADALASKNAAEAAKVAAQAAQAASETAKTAAETAETNAAASATSIQTLNVSTGAAGANVSFNGGTNTLTVPRGDTGATGATGPQGLQGLQGLQGDTGATGSQGLQGDTGATGSQGPQGLQGATGVQGSIGPQGPQGDAFVYADFTAPQLAALTGPQGPQGLQGDQGDQGIQGIQGLQGDQGDQGIQGIQGLQGDQGDQGIQGIQGLQGATGAQGPQGDAFVYADFTAPQLAALTGPAGATGAQGPQGLQGDQGIQGIQGDAFVYADFTAAQLSALTGPQGPQGQQGLQGDQGIQGIQGPAGNDGAVGQQGIQGPAGSDGAVGQQGIQGPAGNDGAVGQQGSQGPTGPAGADGSPDTASQVLTKIKTVDGSGSGLDADLLDGYNSNRFMRRQTKATATAGAGWMTVATCTGSRHHGEIMVTDGDSGDHALIRIEWLRSYADSAFTVLNCGGHGNRITGARVLYQTADNTYGVKLLQVYVTTSSNYEVNVFELGDINDYGVHTAVTPVIENSKTGYAVHGNSIEGLDAHNLAAEEGILAGGVIDGMGGFDVNGTNVIDTSRNLKNINSVEIGTKVTLQESTDRADLLQITGSTTAWSGIQIRNSSSEGRWSFMTDGSMAGIYDDENSEWYMQWNEHGATEIFHNNSQKLTTTSSGIYVTGNIVASANITAYSDRRVKANLEPVTDAVAKVNQLNGLTYTRTDLDDTETRYAGLIAQEVESVLPEAVIESGDRKSLDYNGTIALLVEAVKELSAEVAELKAKQ